MSQEQEDGEKRSDRYENPGDDDGGDGDHTEDLEKYLGRKGETQR